MFKYISILLILGSSSPSFASPEMGHINCNYLYSDGAWEYAGGMASGSPFMLKPRETRVISAKILQPGSYLTKEIQPGPAVTWCSELVGTATDKVIIKTHLYRVSNFQGFYENSCKPGGEGVEFVELNADLIDFGKPFFAETSYPWLPNEKWGTMFNLLTGDQNRKIMAASIEDQEKLVHTLCESELPRY